MRKIFIAFMAVMLLIPLAAAGAGCGSDELEQLREEMAGLQSQVSELTKEAAAKQETIDGLQRELEEKSDAIEGLAADIAEKSNKIVDLEERIVELSKQGEKTVKVGDMVFAVETFHAHTWGIDFDDFAENKGWELLNIDEGPLTFDYLKDEGASILYIPSVANKYSEDEIEAIVEFVENGGGVLLVSEMVYSLTDDIANAFGVKISVGGLLQDYGSTLQPYHPLAKAVEKLSLDGDSYTLVIDEPAYSIQRTSARIVIAAGEIGAGRFVICPRNFELDEADNAQFMSNVLHWLEKADF